MCTKGKISKFEREINEQEDQSSFDECEGNHSKGNEDGLEQRREGGEDTRS